MGAQAAAEVRAAILSLLKEKETIRMIFAAAPSQNEFLAALAADPAIDFGRIEALHMDEYVGLPSDAPQGFGNFLRDRLFGLVPFKAVHYIDGGAADIDAECARYGALLKGGVDIVCMGIGENGHIAFNDPHVADFDDPLPIKKVGLDEVCRMQQVHDGCFASLDQVPTHALTLTIPTLMNAKYHFCMVPAATKAEAVRRTVYGPIGAACPATALRLCGHAVLYVDQDSGAKL
ncbi:MAG: glucosamine-6-phosphate deaminase [Clostridia bacterium]|nr:glucosamine-6-phosphate deaminase [Clostridia bacterium]